MKTQTQTQTTNRSVLALSISALFAVGFEGRKKLSDFENEEDFAAYLTQITDGVDNKNKELLGKIKRLQDKAMPDDIDLEELKKAKGELEELKRKGLEDQGNYKTLYEQQQEQHKTELDALNKKLSASDSQIENYLVKDGITKALSAVNINPKMSEAAVSLLSPQVSLIDADGTKVARVGDKDVESFVKDWAAGEVGKNFVLADGGNGGGAASGGDKDEHDYEKYFHGETKNYTKQKELYEKDPTAYNQLAGKYSS